MRYFRDRKIISFHPTGVPKYVWDNDNKCSFMTDGTPGKDFAKSDL